MKSLVWLNLGLLCLPWATKAQTCPQQNSTTFAMIYGFPLLSYEKAFQALAARVPAPANVMFSSTTLATPQSTSVVKPNVDTLYSSVYYDVSRSDLEVTVPEVASDRYFSVAFYDPYGGNYANLGALTSSPSGKYLLTLASSDNPSGTISMANNSSGYQGTVYSPTTFGIVLIRIVLRNTGSDITAVQNIQKGFTVSNVTREGASTGPMLNSALFVNGSKTTAEHLMNLTARFSLANSNGNSSGIQASTISELSAAGIDNGTYTEPSCVNISSSYASAMAAINTYPLVNGSVISLGNSWTVANSSKIGEYGSDYTARSFIAVFGYLALQVSEAVYPSYSKSLSLMSNESYNFHFSGKPPLPALGFWSLTMYSQDSYLVDNVLNRYALGDRNNLTFSNGTQVYSSEADGPFDILIQAGQPPTNWTSNWLPSPQTPGSFLVTLRFYASTPALTNGTYVYPVVTKGKALGNSTSSSNGTSTTSGGSGTASATSASSGSATSSNAATNVHQIRGEIQGLFSAIVMTWFFFW